MANGYRRWRDSGHLERAIEIAGGPAAFEASVARMKAKTQKRRLDEQRASREMMEDLLRLDLDLDATTMRGSWRR